LRAHSGVLEPVDRVNPYRGRDLGGFLGTGPRAERLDRLLARPDLAPDPEPVRELLADDGRFEAVSVTKDLAGLARVVQARRGP
jgi:hypothetical protein